MGEYFVASGIGQMRIFNGPPPGGDLLYTVPQHSKVRFGPVLALEDFDVHVDGSDVGKTRFLNSQLTVPDALW